MISKDEEMESLRQRVAELEGAEDRYRTLIELGTKIGEAVIMLQDLDNKEGLHVYVSDQWSQITGYSKEELLKKSFFNLVSSRDKKVSKKRHRQKMAGKTIPDLFELTIICKDSKEVPVEITSAVTSYQDKPTNVVYIRDISDRKKIERELRESRQIYQTLFENAPVSLWEFDYTEVKKIIDDLQAKGVIDLKEYFRSHPQKAVECICKVRLLNVNKHTEKMMDGNPALLNRQIEPVKENAIDSQETLNAVTDIIVMLSKGQNILSHEWPFRTLSGRPIYFLQQCSIVPGYENSWGRVIVADVDITERKKMEKELLEYKEHLEKIVEKRTSSLKEEIERRIEYTKWLVHELKTPLIPLVGGTQLLAEKTRGTELQKIVDNVSWGASRLNRRINDLIDITRGEMGILSLYEIKCNIGEVVSKSLEYMMLLVKTRSQKLCFQCPEVLPEVTIDKERIQQIVFNLVDNASKFSPSGATITVKVAALKKRVKVSVIDNGHGISEEQLAILFDSSPPYRKNVEGMGLGLSLCKMLVELHGGSIGAKSKLGKGSTFTFSIPQQIISSKGAICNTDESINH